MTEVENRLLDSGLVADVKVVAMEDRRQYLAAALELNAAGKSKFEGCKKLTVLDVTKFKTSKVTDMRYMFGTCSSLKNLDVTHFDTSNVTIMNGMFSNCEALTSLDLSYFNTSRVAYMSSMFAHCTSLASLDVSKFDTSNVIDMSAMFTECSKLTSLNVSNFCTSSVTNMRNMFFKCSSLTSLDVSKFDTSNVTDMRYMFQQCLKLSSLDVTAFNTSKVTNMSSMFSACQALTSLDLRSFDTSNVTDMQSMFNNSFNLVTIYASDKFVTSAVTNGYLCFAGCDKLVGGAGTTCPAGNDDIVYARIDGGNSAPGYFTLKLIGSKSKPDAVGDIVFSDGSATPYTADMNLTDEQKSKAIAVIFYKGTGLNSGDDTTTSRTLGVGLKHNTSGLAWCLESAAAHDKNITTIQCPASENAESWTFKGFTGDRNGSDNLKQISDFLCLSETDDTGTAENYPAFYFGKNYKDTATNIAGTDYESGWYLPSIAELFQIYACRADTANGFDIDAASEALGGDKFEDSTYWSSSSWDVFEKVESYVLYFYNGAGYRANKDNTYHHVCAVRAFN